MEVNPGYKQTEVGAIPEDWEIDKLGNLGDVIRGASPRPKGDKRYYGGDIPRLMVEDVTRDGKIVIPQIDFLTDEGAKKSRPCKKGTLTIVCSGTVGIPSFLGVDACIHDGFLALVGIKKNLSDDYIYHQLCSLKQSFDNSATHGGIFTNLTTSGVKDFIIPFPATLAEQQAIAKVLTDTDALIEALEQLIAKKRQVKQGAMQALFTPKPDWQVKNLEEIADVIDPHPSHRAPQEVQNGIPFVGIGDLNEQGDIIGNKLRLVDPSVFLEHEIRYNLEEDLIGLGRVASIGKVVKLKSHGTKYVISPTLGVIRGTKVQRNYLLYALKSKAITDQFEKIMSGSTRSSVGMIVLRKLDISLPKDEKEQTEIAIILGDMDLEIAALEEKLMKVKLVKQGMMQELLTGRIRLV